MIRWLVAVLSLFALALPAQSALALTTQPSPPPGTAPGIIVTSIAGNGLLGTDYLVEVYNQADALDIAKWSVVFTIEGCDSDGRIVQTPFPSGWMLYKRYLTISAIDAAAGCVSPRLASVQILNGTEVQQTVTIPATSVLPADKIIQHKQRGNSPNSTRTVSGDFVKDYNVVSAATAVVFNDPLYTPPVDAGGLQILEILPNARDCSPLEQDITCGDYIKLYNPTDQPIDLAGYRLRIGYKGQSESITNTFTWGRVLDPANDELILPPQTYFMLITRDDGEPLKVTDAGGYVWIEDVYGTKIYEPVAQYPDAGSTTKIGWAWAWDGADWRWTSAPQPASANYFPPPAPAAVIAIASSLVPCGAGEYRNPDTNRCRSILAASASLAPCKTGQERNPETNRCRSVLSETSQLQPCGEGQERNPETNRCRKVVSAGGGAVPPAVKDVSTGPIANNPKWWLAGLAVIGAASYGFYEWRHEAKNALAKQKNKLFRRKPR